MAIMMSTMSPYHEAPLHGHSIPSVAPALLLGGSFCPPHVATWTDLVRAAYPADPALITRSLLYTYDVGAFG